MTRLTEKQKSVLKFMREYFIENQRLPSCQAIAENFCYRSPSSGNYFLTSLAKKGYLVRSDTHYKFSNVTVELIDNIKVLGE